MNFERTEGLERFNKVVSYMGLYVPPDEQNLIDQNMLEPDEFGTCPTIHAYVNEECANDNRGFLIALVDEQVYMCYETEYDGEKLYCNGSVPAFSYTDEMLIEHLGNQIREYKDDLSRKKKAALLQDFE